MTRANKFQELVECSEEDEYMHHTYQMHHGQRQGHYLHLNQTSQWYFFFSSGYQPRQHWKL